MSGRPRPLWRCPRCRQTFVTKHIWHSCVRLTIAEFFRGHETLIPLYRAFLRFVRQHGPVTVNVNKTRISFQGRVRFAGVSALTRTGLVCSFWLKRRIAHPRFSKVDHYPPRDYVYRFTLTDASQLDDQLKGWIAEAYAVGQQQTLG